MEYKFNTIIYTEPIKADEPEVQWYHQMIIDLFFKYTFRWLMIKVYI